jgi:hypothetical protein
MYNITLLYMSEHSWFLIKISYSILSIYSLVSIIYLFWWYRGLNSSRVFMLVRQALYCLSHNFNTIWYGYFRDRVRLYVQENLDQNPYISCFLPLLGWQVCATMPRFFFRLKWEGVSKNFFWVSLKLRSS